MKARHLLWAAVVLGAGCSGKGSQPPPATTTTTESTDLLPMSSDGVSLRGTLKSELPAGKPGQVDVVRSAARLSAGSTLPVVVRNNTAGLVTGVVVSATATDAGGVVVATGASEALAPWNLGQGQLAIGYVSFAGPVPEGVTYAFTTGSGPPVPTTVKARIVATDEPPGFEDVFVIRAVPESDQLRGRVQNRIGVGVRPIVVTYACFDRDGVPTEAGRLPPDPAGLGAGDSADFKAPLSGACDGLLVGAYGKALRI